jgi:hypothetical protein
MHRIMTQSGQLKPDLRLTLRPGNLLLAAPHQNQPRLHPERTQLLRRRPATFDRAPAIGRIIGSIKEGNTCRMMGNLREAGKRSAGWLVSRTSERYRYRNCIFLLAHMRCGSTALSNILCSRTDISGYGETHVRYDGRGALGRLALNQMRRESWTRDADYLFDKILHCRHDRDASAEFFEARAIFLVRHPDETISSIVDLFTRLGRRAYDTPHKAARYYIERLQTLTTLWHRFPSHRRVGVTHESLLREPDGTLSRISQGLRLTPKLENRYVSPPASRKAGGGDPLVSGLHRRIEPALLRPRPDREHPDLPPELARQVLLAHAGLVSLFEPPLKNARA